MLQTETSGVTSSWTALNSIFHAINVFQVGLGCRLPAAHAVLQRVDRLLPAPLAHQPTEARVIALLQV